jgi:hypothetical protein
VELGKNVVIIIGVRFMEILLLGEVNRDPLGGCDGGCVNELMELDVEDETVAEPARHQRRQTRWAQR